MNSSIHLLGISGSLRKGSYNTGLLRAAAELLPENTTLTLADISDIPLYNQDVFDEGMPAPVQRLREQIGDADALVIATPEYNYSVPAVLKNAIDWASRPAPTTPLNQKPVAIMGASGGQFGTVRAQLHLRHILVYLDMLPLNKPEVLVNGARSKFDAEGNLTDQPTRELIRQQLEALARWTHRLRGE